MSDRICSVPGCEKPVDCHGWCLLHSGRWRRHGDPLAQVRDYNRAERTTCLVDGCGRRPRARGWCKRHHARWLTYGDPTAPRPSRSGAFSPGRRPTPVAERLLRRVEVDAETGCWIFTGYLNRSGYGTIGMGSRSVDLAHRVAYRIWLGPIPPGLQIDHVWERGCRHRNCVCPDHLEAVTAEENTRRAWEAARTRGVDR